MTGFRVLLVAMFLAVTAYTVVTFTGHGWNLLAVFFGDMMKLAWPGQFDLDFMCMLALSALWVAWRHTFSAAGVGLAVLSFFLGTAFLSVYLVVMSVRARGDIAELLLGPARAAARR